jgi:hypothetical protein
VWLLYWFYFFGLPSPSITSIHERSSTIYFKILYKFRSWLVFLPRFLLLLLKTKYHRCFHDQSIEDEKLLFPLFDTTIIIYECGFLLFVLWKKLNLISFFCFWSVLFFSKKTEPLNRLDRSVFPGSRPVRPLLQRFICRPVLHANRTGHRSDSRFNRFDRPVRSSFDNLVNKQKNIYLKQRRLLKEWRENQCGSKPNWIYRAPQILTFPNKTILNFDFLELESFFFSLIFLSLNKKVKKWDEWR